MPDVIEMQSEGGAAGALHGALQAGALATTFTASQGLLLMLPNMFKIAGELTPAVMHVAARTVATHALSIFGDHSDVMAARDDRLRDAVLLVGAGGAGPGARSRTRRRSSRASRSCTSSTASAPRTRWTKIEPLADDDLRALIADDARHARTARARLTPDHPVLRGSAQNPDVFFQAREAANSFYARGRRTSCSARWTGSPS